MKFRCPYGHTEIKGGRPVPMVHASREKCAIYVQLRAAGKVDVFGRAKPGVQLGTPGAASADPGAPPGPAAPEPAGSAPAGAPIGPPKSGETPGPKPADKPSPWQRLKGGLEVGYRRVTTTGPLPPGMQAEQADWEVFAETSERVGALINSWLETGFRFLTSWFQIPEIPKEVFEQDPGQAFVWRTALRGAVTNFLKKVMGAKSPEHADQIVAAMSGLTAYAIMGGKIMFHLSIHIPKSPRLAKWRENRKKALEERKALAEAKAALERRHGPPVGFAPAGAKA